MKCIAFAVSMVARVRQLEAYFSIILGLSYLFSTQSFPEKPKSRRHANYN